MKALVLLQPGTPDTLQMTELPVPMPGPEEVRVRVCASSLNPADYKLAMNGLPSWTYPFIPGIDVAGIVDEVGEHVSQWKKGDRVVYIASFARNGAFAEYHIANAHIMAAIPDELSFTEAAAFPCAGLTAYEALIRKMRIQKGQTILIHAGAGGVGGYAIQLAKASGASMILTTTSAHNFDYVKERGADIAIDYNHEDVHARVMEATQGVGVDLILNAVNRATAQQDLSLLAFGGQLACIAGAPDTVADFQPSFKSFTLHRLSLGGAFASGNRKAEENLSLMADEFMRLLATKAIHSTIHEVIALDEVPSALVRLSQRHVRGKIVIDMSK